MEQDIKKKIWVDELTSEEVKELWDEAQLLALDDLHHPETGAPMTREEAREVIDRMDAEAKERELNISKVKAARRIALGKCRRAHAKRAKLSRRKNR
jgi:hypothetical protein